MATIGTYIGGLVITPLICLVFIGAGIIDPAKIFIILTELIIVPVISRVLMSRNLVLYLAGGLM